MKIGLFLTNQQFTTTDMVKALDEQIQMVHHARDNGCLLYTSPSPRD